MVLGRCRRARRVVGRLYQGCHKAISPSTNRLDHPLPLPIVSDGAARGHDAVVKGGITDKLGRPQVFEEFVLGDNAVTMLDEVRQQIEHLGLELEECASAAQLVEPRVEFVLVEGVDHRTRPSVRCRTQVCSSADNGGGGGGAS